MRNLKTIFALAVLGSAAGRASAQTATTYSYKYIAQQPAFTVPVNSDLTINLYLQEANSDQSTHSLLANEHGLTSAGVQVIFATGSATTIITGSADNSGTPPAGFDDSGNTATFTAATAMISESTDLDPFGSDLVGVKAGPQTAGISDVFLGAVTIHTSSFGGVSTTFTVGTTDSTIGATFTNDNAYSLDNNAAVTNAAGASSFYSNAQSTTFTVTTSSVPEPATLSFIFPLCLWLSLSAGGRPAPPRPSRLPIMIGRTAAI
jgi:hypothetical protein